MPRLTIGRKLGLSFGVILALMVGSAAISYRASVKVRQVQDRVIDLRVPTVRAGGELLNGMNHSLAALRGYIILGADPAKGEYFKNDRQLAWDEIDNALAQMRTFSKSWTVPANVERLEALSAEVAEFRVAQQEVEDIAQSPDNIPSYAVLLNEAAPRAGRMLKAVTAIIDEESGLEATPERKALLKNLADTRGSFAVGLANIRAYLLSGDENFWGNFQKKWAINDKVFVDINGKLDLFTTTQREQWDIYAANRKDFAPLPTKMFELRSASDWNKANSWLGTKAAPKARAIKAELSVMVESQKKLMADDRLELKSTTDTANFTLVVITLVATILGIIVAVVVGRSTAGGIRSVVNRIKDIAEGEGDLTQRVDQDRADELGELGMWFNTLIERIHDLIASVSGAANEVAGASTQIAASAEEMATGMQEQTGQVTQISAAVEEMSASVIEVARKSSEASNSAAESGKLATEGGQVVSETITGMHAISDAVSSSAASVSELGKRGQQIGQIIEVINDIADQTNLLALNAAIEAARAGEHGRGFAVVADEVRKLADRTTKATEEIGESITAIQTETDLAVNRMGSGTEQVQEGVQKATRAGESLEKIVAGAQEVTGMIQSIAAAAEQQSSAAEEISRSIQSVSAVTSQVSEGTAQSAQAATQLSTKAEQLLGLVGKFKIKVHDRREREDGPPAGAQERRSSRR